MTGLRRIRILVAGACLCAPAAVAAQDGLAQRIAAAPADAVVRFDFAAAPGVCGIGDNVLVRTMRNGQLETSVRHGSWSTMSRNQAEPDCETGPVEVRLTRRAGTVAAVDVRVGRSPVQAGNDLGSVSARAAVDFLLDLQTLRRAESRAARNLVSAATLADAEYWPQLLEVSRSRDMDRETRSTAIFYLSQVAADRALAGLEDVIRDDSDDMEVRKSAVFALSRSGDEQAVDMLIELARSHSEPAIRRNAMFWLSRTGSPKAVAFFEEVLRGTR